MLFLYCGNVVTVLRAALLSRWLSVSAFRPHCASSAAVLLSLLWQDFTVLRQYCVQACGSVAAVLLCVLVPVSCSSLWQYMRPCGYHHCGRIVVRGGALVWYHCIQYRGRGVASIATAVCQYFADNGTSMLAVRFRCCGRVVSSRWQYCCSIVFGGALLWVLRQLGGRSHAV